MLGAQSAFFTPCKYAILPQLLKKQELIAGNALVSTGTYVAILAGTILGTVLALRAGGIEAAVIAKTIETGKVAPTINIDDPDPDCDLNYVPNESVEADINVAMSNNLGFGGHNATIVFKKFK